MHDPLVHHSLDLVQDRRALLPVTLLSLLAEEVVDVRIAPVGVRAGTDDEGLEAGGGVAWRRRDRDEDALQLLRPPRLHVGRALHAPDSRANADRSQVVR